MNSIIFLICTHMSSFGFVCIFVTQSLRCGEIVSSVGLGLTSGFSSISHSGQVPDGVCVRSTRTSGRQIAQVGRSPMLDPGGASSCWLELGCKRVDGSMPHKHCAMLSPTPWLQGGRVRRNHQFGDLRHCSCHYHGHLHHCVIHQQPLAQGKATGVEASEMLCPGDCEKGKCLCGFC
ncbi:hypothetical protein ACQJBY_057940 [Aegilops geniculata]